MMKMFRRREPDRPELDRRTLDQVLEGDRAVPVDAQPLARVLRAAAAPPYPEELRGEHAALLSFRAAQGNVAPERKRRGRSLPMNLLSTKALAALIIGTATAGGFALAASTGMLPDIGTPNDAVSSTPGSPVAKRTSTAPGVTGGSGDTTGPTGSPSTAIRGLCEAYLATNRPERSKALESPAFQDLVRAAGSADQVEPYCTALLSSPTRKDRASEHPGGGPPSGHPTRTDSVERSDKPPARRTASPGR